MRSWRCTLTLLGVLTPTLIAAQSITLTQSSIRLFEQDGGNVLDPSKRVYTTYYNSLRTRYIGVEASLDYAAAPEAFTLPVSCQETRPDGKVVGGIWKIPVKIAAGSTHADGANLMFGAGTAGWQAGLYKVTCSASRQLGEIQFQMSPGPSLLLDTEVRLGEVKFFPTGATVTPLAQREYLDSFSSAEATRIGIELTFVQPPPGKSGQFPVDCYILTPGGNVLGTLQMIYEIEPTGTGGSVARGIGWDQPGHWVRGDYLAICQVHGRPISVSRFSVW